MNEFDRFVQHELKPLGYVRYGDDFILWGQDKASVTNFQSRGKVFLQDKLKLSLHGTNHAVQSTQQKLHFLGIEFWPAGHRLDKRMRSRSVEHVSINNQASYDALIRQFGSRKRLKQFYWDTLDIATID